MIYIARVLVPNAWADWGLVALLTAWIFASMAPVALESLGLLEKLGLVWHDARFE